MKLQDNSRWIYQDIIKKNETYRITVEKRQSSLHTKDIISNIADSLLNKVSLKNSDWEIIIQILGDTEQELV